MKRIIEFTACIAAIFVLFSCVNMDKADARILLRFVCDEAGGDLSVAYKVLGPATSHNLPGK
ncbi:MAG: hypothetical protein JXR63_00065 [Spirochaetales bacterium]|nr:hypothetical protein [Spirochaetales bacterium]